jgi:hypothetical protein
MIGSQETTLQSQMCSTGEKGGGQPKPNQPKQLE